MPPLLNKAIHFGSFLVTPQVFYTTTYSFALVNIKPILPGHVLVCPLRRAPRLSDLSQEEISDLFITAQRVGRMIERVFKASALNVAVQDGEAAGQSVAHVHAHIIPRAKGDLDHKGGGDAIYDMMESEEGNVGKSLEQRDKSTASDEKRGGPFSGLDNDSRVPRSAEEMRTEAEWLAKEMDREQDSEG